jgi:hypothetical protein
MKKYMRIADAIAKRSYEYYAKLFSQPPLTEEKGVGVVLKFRLPNTAWQRKECQGGRFL